MSSRAARLLVFTALVFLLFFRASFAFRAIQPDYDDGGYLSWLFRFVGESPPFHPKQSFLPGIAILWLPAGLVAKAGACLTRRPLTEWIPPLVAMESFALWASSVFLLDAWVTRALPGATWILTAGLLLNTPVLYYATARPYLSHSGEIFLVALFLVLLQRERFVAAAGVVLLTVATRLNDAPLLGCLVAALWERRRRGERMPVPVWLVTIAGGALAVWLGLVVGYQGIHVPRLLGSVSHYGFLHAMASPHFGLIWTASWWLWCLWDGLYAFARLSLTARAAVLWMVAELWLVTAWRGDGSDFGYRYLVGSYAGAFLVWAETRDKVPAGAPRFSRVLLAVTAAGVTIETWFYRTAPHYGLPMQKETLLRLAHPSTWLPPAGLSPLGILVYSHALRAPWLAAYRSWEKHALTSPVAQGVLGAALVVAIGVAVGSLQLSRYLADTEHEESSVVRENRKNQAT